MRTAIAAAFLLLALFAWLFLAAPGPQEDDHLPVSANASPEALPAPESQTGSGAGQEPVVMPGDEGAAISSMEPFNQDIRRVAPEEIVAPVLEPMTRIERLPALPPPEPPRRKEKPLVFARPLVLSAGEVRSAGLDIALKGIKAPGADAVCGSGVAAWPCGNFARAALQRLIRARTLSCSDMTGEGKDRSAICSVGSQDLAEWLVSQGWAEAEEPALVPLMESARAARLGIWRE